MYPPGGAGGGGGTGGGGDGSGDGGGGDGGGGSGGAIGGGGEGPGTTTEAMVGPSTRDPEQPDGRPGTLPKNVPSVSMTYPSRT